MARRFNPARLQAVEQALAAMEPFSMIQQRLAKEWACSRRSVQRCIAEVLRVWKERAESTSPDERRAQLTEMALDVYREARRNKHARAALSAIDTIARMHGITNAQAMSVVNVYDQRGALTSPQAITDRLRELRAQQLTAGDDDDEPEGGSGGIVH